MEGNRMILAFMCLLASTAVAKNWMGANGELMDG